MSPADAVPGRRRPGTLAGREPLGTGHRILVTGSEGLAGRALRASLDALGWATAGLDLRGEGRDHGDVRCAHRVRAAIAGCRGVVHLAAVSRVVWAEQDPDNCRSTNVQGVRRILEAAHEATPRPWVLFASSREVYGQPLHLPATEDTPLSPVNVYGHSKVAGERLVERAAAGGLLAATVRLSNVYGSARDHADRVVPAFARAAAEGSAIRMDGAECSFDFTHIDDAVRGLVAIIGMLKGGETPPPIHLLTGTPTTLGELAALAEVFAGKRLPVVEAPPRSFDVGHFHGDPSLAQQLLGWAPRVGLRDGFARLVHDLRVRSDAIACGKVAR